MHSLRRLHLGLGLLTLAVFLLSGAYMRLVAHPGQLPDGPHLMFVSRHIYILANALVHLALGTYASLDASPGGRRWQWIGSALLAASSLLLVTAFVVEPMAGRGRTLVSTLGIDALFAGVLVHLIAGWRRRAEP